MLDRWYKIAVIIASAVIIVSAIVGPGIGGVFWLARLDNDVANLQEDVTELQEDVATILSILQTMAEQTPEIRADLDNHTHGDDGRTQFDGR